MSSKVQAALEARKKQKEEEEKKRFSVEDALSFRDSQIKKNLQSTLADLQDSLTKEVESYNSLNALTYGTDLKSVLESTNESRVNLGDLKRKAEAYRKYIGDDKTNEIVSYIDKLKNGYDSYLSNAEVFSAFDTEDDYNNAVKDQENTARLYGMSTSDILPYLEDKKNPIAYTTSDGRNITWQNLYETKKQEEAYKTLYETLSSKEDWEQNSQYIPTASSKYNSFESLFDRDADWDYEKINGKAMNANLNGADSTSKKYLYQELTDEEKQVFNYLYHTGRDGSNVAYEWLESMRGVLEQRQLSTAKENAKLLANADPTGILPTVVSIGANVLATPAEEAADYLKLLFTGESSSNTSAAISSTLRGTVMENTDWMVGDFDAHDFLYSTGTSALDSLGASALYGKGAGLALGLSASAQGRNDALARGLSPEKAALNGFAAGLFEGLFETVSLGQFSKFKANNLPGLKNFVADLAKVSGVNALEETGTEIANLIYDRVVNGDFSQYETKIRQYMQFERLSEAEAKKKVASEEALQVVEAGASGALMGLGFGVGGKATNAVADTKVGKSSVKKGEVSNIVEIGKTYAPDTVTYKLANKITDKSSPYDIGSLVRSIGIERSGQNLADIQKTLESRGIATESAAKIAKWLNKAADGDVFTKKERNDLLYSEDIGEAFRDLFINENSPIMQRNQAVQNISSIEKADVSENTPAKDNAGTEAKSKSAFQGFALLSKEEVERRVQEEPGFAMKYAMWQGQNKTDSAVSTPETSLIKGDIKVSEDGSTFDTTTGEAVANFKEISDISKDGKVAKLRLEDGSEINAKDLTLGSSSDAMMIEGLLNMTVDSAHIDADTANVLLKEMRNSTNAPLSNKAAFNNLATMIAGTREALTYGYYGYDSKQLIRDSGMASEISDSLRNTAYVLGRDLGKGRRASNQAKITDAIEERKQGGVEKAETKGKLRFSESEKKALAGLSSEQKAVVDFFRDVSVATPSGIKLIGYDERANGYTNLTTGEMVFSLESNASRDPVAAVLFTAGHESGHYIKLYNPEGFNRLGEFLAKEYGKKGESVHAHVLAMQKKSKSKLTYDEAHEEWVCQSLQRMFASVINNKDSGVLQRLQQYDNKVAQLLYKALSKLASRINSLLEKLTPGTFEEQFVAEMDATVSKLFESMYAEELVTAIDNAQWLSGVDVMTEILGNKSIEVGKTSVQEMNRTQTRFQEKTEYESQPKEIITVGTDANKPKANRKTLGGKNKVTIAGKTFEGDVSVKELRDARFEENGFSQEEIDKHNEFIQHMADMMKVARVKYRFIGLDDIYNAKVLISPTSGEITLSALVNNGDYPINFDFTKICKKRVALQQIVDQLAREKGKKNSDGTVTEVNLSPENIKAINDILAREGIETACLCCFVESKRYNIQSLVQENVINVWNSLVDEFDSNAGYFNFADESVNESKIPDKEFDALYEQVVAWRKQKGKSSIPKDKMQQFLETTPAARKKLRFSDLVTEKGRTNLHKLYPDIESLIGSTLGTAAPKSVEAFAPYNGEIDLMESTSETGMREYLFSIAGARSQSFSDFMIAHIFDVVQKTASLSARKFPAHVYTKEIARAKLFGMTGEKHNMSVLFNIDPEVDSWNAGLKKDGSYFLSDYKAYSKKESQYIQSIGWDDAVNLQNTEGYSKDCGIIAVGFSYNNMIKIHNDPDVRQVIGYHTSSLPAVVKPLTNLDKAADYTPVQNTLAFVGFVKPMYAIPEGVPSYATPPQDVQPIKGDAKTQKVNDTFDIKATFKKLAKGKKGEARTQAAKETLRQLLEYAESNGLALKTKKAEAGHGDFDLYSDVDKTKNPYMSADHYIEYCIEKGYLPAFFEFAMNQNYYKDIFDWSPFDRLSYNPETGLHEDSDGRQAYAPQTAVHMLNEDGSYAFPSDFFEIVDKQMKNYDEYSHMVKDAMPDVMKAITSIEGMGSNLKLQEKVSEDAKAFARDIDHWNRDGKPHGESFILGSTGDVLQGLGAIESDIYMLGDKINEILIKHPEMTLDEIKKIPQILENPILILKSKGEDRGNNNNTRLVIFGSVKAKDNRPILSVLDLRPQEDNLVIDDMQKVTSAYTKDNNPVSFVRSSDVLYADKNKTTKLLKSIGFQMPIELQQSGYIGSISYFKRSVNIKGESFSNVFKEDVVRFQERSDEDISNRGLLANALESAAAPGEEKNLLRNYKTNIRLIEAEQKRLSEIKDKLFEKGSKIDPDERKKLQSEMKQTATRINSYDRQLLKLEAMQPIKKVLEREKELAKKRQKQKDMQILADYKEKSKATVKELLERNQESRKKAVEGRNKTLMRHKIKGVVNELNQLLLKGTKDKHVMIGLQKAVAEALDAVNMDTVGADERIAKYNALIAKAKDPDVIASLTASRDRIAEQGGKMSERLTALKDAYSKIKNSDDPLIANSHDEVIENKIESVVNSIGNTPLRDMTLSQLEDVYDMYKMVLTTIRNSNKAFKMDKAESIASIGNNIMGEVYSIAGEKQYTPKALEGLKSFGWSSLKPTQAFEAIGSGTFKKVFENVRAGEDTWAVDVSEARDYYREKSSKYGYDSWDLDQRYEFTSKSGKKFWLSLEQIMSLYAYSKRKQADLHLDQGGFVFDESIEVVEKKKGIPIKYKVNTANAYSISKEELGNIVGTLSDRQRFFVDEMQAYLSDVMGAKGNEVSLEMYGVKLFKEQFYFPLKSAKQFMFEQNEVAGEVKIKNSGFSKETVDRANNPIILSNFMDVWSKHVNDMSMYHAFVLPLEDFNRVFNYKTPTSDTMNPESVKSYLQNAYGTQPVQYIKQLITDLNGGARVDASAGFVNKGIALFKKGAVFASASVVIQQPSAIARAFAYINPKYFATAKVDLTRHSRDWEECKQYAPVARIKEMGYFDTNVGPQTTEWITAKEYKGFKEKLKGLKDSEYRDELLSKAPALADELAWTHIWNAVKKEIASTTNLKEGSEAFLKRAGERFTEVVVNTQVYDSVLSRSGLMRSKDTGVKMATAFMAEPTTSLNMIVNAFVQAKRGNKKLARNIVGGVASSIIFNSILVSLVYAARDDDEDETYAEKYLGSMVSELIDGFNPITYIPFAKDIWSIAQGYDVERSDMSVYSKLWESFEELFDENKSVEEKVTDFSGSVATLFGFPLKNILRDINAVINLATNDLGLSDTTGAGLGYSVSDALRNSIPLLGRFYEEDTKAKKLYDAILGGDATEIERAKKQFKNEDAIETAIRTALRENDPRIKEAAQARIGGDISKYKSIAMSIIFERNFSQDIVVGAINAEINVINKEADDADEFSDDEEESKATSIYKASDINAALESGDTAAALEVINDLVKVKTENYIAEGEKQKDAEKKAKSSVKSSVTSYWKPLYLAAYNAKNNAEMARIRKLLNSTKVYDNVVETCQDWVKQSKKSK